MLLFFLLFVVLTTAQDICSSNGALVQEPPAGTRPTLRQPQKVLYVNILPGYDADMYTGFVKLNDTIRQYYPGSTATFKSMAPNDRALQVTDLEQYTQVWVADLGSSADNSANQMATYAAISNWYKNRGNPHLILDGRWISSLWAANQWRPNVKLIENYFVNLAIRGGGMLLATDHAEDFTRGINEINKGIDIGVFYGYYYPADPNLRFLEVDTENPLMKYPNDPTHHNRDGKFFIYDDSSTSFTPYNQQKNGLILFPVGWHGAKGIDNPGLSSTIRGALGFIIDIVSPTCGQRIVGGQQVTFTAKVTKGGTGNISWKWTSSLSAQPIGDSISFTWIPQNGQHVVTVTATDSQNLKAEAQVSFRVYYDSTKDNGGFGPNGDGSCYIFTRAGSVAEVFPISRAVTPVQYYNYGGGNARTSDLIEASENLAANFFLYTDGKTLAIEGIMSNTRIRASLRLEVSGRGTIGRGTSLALKDDPSDNFSWASEIATGIFEWDWKQTTKGFVIDGLPMTKDINNNWCITFNIKNVTTLEHLKDWSHELPSSTVPNTSPVYGSTSFVLGIPTISYCRTTCYVPPVVNLTTTSGFITPPRVDWTTGTGGINYNDKTGTTWMIAPKTNDPIAGIAIHFVGPLNISSGDFLKVFPGFSQNPVLDVTGTTTIPNSVRINDTSALVKFIPNGDGNSAPGFGIWYSVIPTVGSFTPTNGPQESRNWVTISGANFENTGKNVIKFGDIVISGPDNIKVDSPNSIRVNVPPSFQNSKTVPVDVSNDGVYFVRAPQNYTFFSGSCRDVTNCGDCFNVKSCVWCTSVNKPQESFCFNSSQATEVCPNDEAHNTLQTCSDAPDFSTSLMEGETKWLTLVKPELRGKVTSVRISGNYTGMFTNVTNGVAMVNAQGAIQYKAYMYLNGLTNVDKFKYTLLGNGINDTGTVTLNITPLNRDALLGLYAKQLEDECKAGTHECQQLCLDGTPIGDYICGCRAGFKLVGKRQCQDIDECAAGISGCTHGCVNTPGSFQCLCPVGKNMTNGVCVDLPCPLTDWVEIVDNTTEPKEMTAELANFIDAVVTAQPQAPLDMLPGLTCNSCDGVIEKRRSINQTAWNGSIRCGANAAALIDKQPCGYPCRNTAIFQGITAVRFAVEELNRANWFSNAIHTIYPGGTLSVSPELPDLTGVSEPWKSNYFRVLAPCDDAFLNDLSKSTYGLMEDILPIFADKKRIKVNIMKETNLCYVKVTIDDLLPKLEACPDAEDDGTGFSKEEGRERDGLSSGEMAAITLVSVVSASAAGMGVFALATSAPAAAADPYVAL